MGETIPAATATPALLTLENLKAFSSPPSHTYQAPLSSVDSEEDAASLFSDPESVLSSASSKPEDDEAPFTVQDDTGESITVYSSLEQAVRYSLLRADRERRAEEEARQFAYAPPPSALPSHTPVQEFVTSTSLDAVMVGAGSGGDDVDGEDAYFSMG